MVNYNNVEQPYPEVLYYHVAKDALKIAKQANQNTNEHEYIRKKANVTAMVFSALCLETFIIQEYYLHTETRKIIDDNPQIPPETKWLLLPLLLGSKVTFDKGKTRFQKFHELVFDRNNRIVHFKPEKEIIYDEKEPYKNMKYTDLVNDTSRAESYLTCIDDMIGELNRITDGKTRTPKFLHAKFLSSVSASSGVNIESR